MENNQYTKIRTLYRQHTNKRKQITFVRSFTYYQVGKRQIGKWTPTRCATPECPQVIHVLSHNV